MPGRRPAVAVPADAVLFHQGRPLVYVQVEPRASTGAARSGSSAGTAMPGPSRPASTRAASGLEPGEVVVRRGPQVLLSRGVPRRAIDDDDDSRADPDAPGHRPLVDPQPVAVVVVLSALLLAFGLYAAEHAQLDVFPEFVPAAGHRPDRGAGTLAGEVEQLVTLPIEQAISSASRAGCAVRSQSIQGLSVITV